MRDVYRAAASLVETGMTAKDAVSQAMGPWGKRYIRTSTPRDAEERLAKWLEKYSKINSDLVLRGDKPLFRCVFTGRYRMPLRYHCMGIAWGPQACTANGKIHGKLHPPLPFLCVVFLDLSTNRNRERRGAQASTQEAVDNVTKCLQKGCLFSDLPEEEQYSVDSMGPKTGLRLYHKRIGTGKNEGLHGCASDFVSFLSE